MAVMGNYGSRAGPARLPHDAPHNAAPVPRAGAGIAPPAPGRAILPPALSGHSRRVPLMPAAGQGPSPP